MRTVPELVFVNCCHLGRGDADQLLNYDRAEFASGVAGALIEIGVRCVVAAGWAVDDDAASVFAEDVLRVAASREPFHRRRRRGARGGVRPQPACEHVGGLPVLRRPGLGVPAKGAGPQSGHRALGRGLLGRGLGDVVEARARADRRPDEVSGRRSGDAARQPEQAGEAVRSEVGEERRRGRALRRGVRRGRRRREPECAGTNAPWPRRTERRR